MTIEDTQVSCEYNGPFYNGELYHATQTSITIALAPPCLHLNKRQWQMTATDCWMSDEWCDGSQE